jgi:hypothetical protein
MLTQSTAEKNHSVQLAAEKILQAAVSLENSWNSSGATFRIALENEARLWRKELEDQLRLERLATQANREAWIQQKVAETAEMARLRRTFWARGMQWALLISGMAMLTSLWAVWELPYKALPLVLQARAEQLASLEAQIRNLKTTVEGSSDPDWGTVKPMLEHDPEDPAKLFIRVPAKADVTTINKDFYRIRIQ